MIPTNADPSLKIGRNHGEPRQFGLTRDTPVGVEVRHHGSARKLSQGEAPISIRIVLEGRQIPSGRVGVTILRKRSEDRPQQYASDYRPTEPDDHDPLHTSLSGSSLRGDAPVGRRRACLLLALAALGRRPLPLITCHISSRVSSQLHQPVEADSACGRLDLDGEPRKTIEGEEDAEKGQRQRRQHCDQAKMTMQAS